MAMDPRLFEIPPYAMGNSSPIRKFNDSNIQAQIDRAVANIGDKNGAVVAHLDPDRNFVLSVVAKKGEHWTVVAAGYRAASGKWSGEAAVSYSW